MRKLEQSYIQYLISKKQISKHTEDAYLRDMNHFYTFITNQGICDLRGVTATTINSYVLYMEKEHQSAATINRRAAVIRGLYGYLFKKKWIEEDVTEFFTTPKIEKTCRTISSREVVEQILLVMQGRTPKVLRDKAMLLLLYTTTMNVEDIIALQIRDVNLEVGYVRCGAAKKEQTFRCSKEVTEALILYLREGRRQYIKPDTKGLLFPNASGGKMSRQGFYKCVKAYAKKAGIEETPTLRSIRMMTE